MSRTLGFLLVRAVNETVLNPFGVGFADGVGPISAIYLFPRFRGRSRIGDLILLKPPFALNFIEPPFLINMLLVLLALDFIVST